jgi:hypothetical protein
MSYNFNIIVHTLGQPMMVISNFPGGTVPTYHISYRGRHYNSVRPLDDNDDRSPALPTSNELHPVGAALPK